VARQYYNAAFDFPNSVGGTFWWNFISEFRNDNVMQGIVAELRDNLIAGAMGHRDPPFVGRYRSS
jgi:hypothetical protein